MEKKLEFLLKLSGHDPKEERFINVKNFDDFDTTSIFEWTEQEEGFDYWYDFYRKYNEYKLPKNNKLNRKLYPEYIDLLGE